MELLHSALVYDPFGLITPGSFFFSFPSLMEFEHKPKLEAKLKSEIAYASTHWVYHVVKALHYDAVLQAAQEFIFEKLLNWLEFMSWRKQTARCVLALSYLDTCVRRGRRSQKTSNVSFTF
jgi:hypothetical protein